MRASHIGGLVSPTGLPADVRPLPEPPGLPDARDPGIPGAQVCPDSGIPGCRLYLGIFDARDPGVVRFHGVLVAQSGDW